jgi:hypothetical protein
MSSDPLLWTRDKVIEVATITSATFMRDLHGIAVLRDPLCMQGVETFCNVHADDETLLMYGSHFMATCMVSATVSMPRMFASIPLEFAQETVILRRRRWFLHHLMQTMVLKQPIIAYNLLSGLHSFRVLEVTRPGDFAARYDINFPLGFFKQLTVIMMTHAKFPHIVRLAAHLLAYVYAKSFPALVPMEVCSTLLTWLRNKQGAEADDQANSACDARKLLCSGRYWMSSLDDGSKVAEGMPPLFCSGPLFPAATSVVVQFLMDVLADMNAENYEKYSKLVNERLCGAVLNRFMTVASRIACAKGMMWVLQHPVPGWAVSEQAHQLFFAKMGAFLWTEAIACKQGLRAVDDWLYLASEYGQLSVEWAQAAVSVINRHRGSSMVYFLAIEHGGNERALQAYASLVHSSMRATRPKLKWEWCSAVYRAAMHCLAMGRTVKAGPVCP